MIVFVVTGSALVMKQLQAELILVAGTVARYVGIGALRFALDGGAVQPAGNKSVQSRS